MPKIFALRNSLLEVQQSLGDERDNKAAASFIAQRKGAENGHKVAVGVDNHRNDFFFEDDFEASKDKFEQQQQQKQQQQGDEQQAQEAQVVTSHEEIEEDKKKADKQGKKKVMLRTMIQNNVCISCTNKFQ